MHMEKRRLGTIAWNLWIALSLLGAPPMAGPSLAAESESKKEIVTRNNVAARVNGAEIDARYVALEANRLVERMGHAHAEKKAEAGLRSRALDILMLRELGHGVDVHHIDPDLLGECIDALRESALGQTI